MIAEVLLIADTEPVLLPSCTWGYRAGSAAFPYLGLRGPAAAGDRISGSVATSPVVFNASSSSAAPQGFPPAPLPWVISWGQGQARGSKEASARVVVGSPRCCQLGAAWRAGNAASDTQLLNIVPGCDQRRQGPVCSY